MTITLPKTVAAWMPSRPWLRVKSGSPATLQTSGAKVSIDVVFMHSSILDQHVTAVAADLTSSKRSRLQLVVSPFLRRSIREILEQHGIGYADSRGHLHLSWKGLLVHIEGEPAERAAPQRVAGLGINGARAVQALLTDDASSVQVSRLAARVRLSLAQTHQVLVVLEQEGLVRTTGSGPSTRRVVNDRTRLLDWLSAQAIARRRGPRLDVALYARRPDELWRDVSKKLARHGVAHGLTGVAAATLLGVGATAVPRSTIRIAPDVKLETIARYLDAEVTDRGANLRLLRDTGRVGSIDVERRGEITLAPRVRVYLDLLADKRGEDLAQQFRETVLGY